MDQALLKDVIGELAKASDLLYQENLQPGYMTLVAVLPNLEEVIAGMSEEEQRNVMVEKLQLAMDAMEVQDATLLADIIQYELIEQLETYIE